MDPCRNPGGVVTRALQHDDEFCAGGSPDQSDPDLAALAVAESD